VVVPRELAAAIVGGAQAKVDAEAERMKQISRGELVQAWVTEALKAVGVLGKNEQL
jgi:regulator of RNase E activity RraA